MNNERSARVPLANMTQQKISFWVTSTIVNSALQAPPNILGIGKQNAICSFIKLIRNGTGQNHGINLVLIVTSISDRHPNSSLDSSIASACLDIVDVVVLHHNAMFLYNYAPLVKAQRGRMDGWIDGRTGGC